MEMDIQVAPVQSLLKDAASEFDELEAVRQKLDSQIEFLAETLEKCAEVAVAVTGVGTDILRPDQIAIMVRCNNAVMGVTRAVSEYQQGNEEMVMNAQRAAASSEGKSFQDLHGYYARAEE